MATVHMDPAEVMAIGDRLSHGIGFCPAPDGSGFAAVARAVDGGGDLAREVDRLQELNSTAERLLQDGTGAAEAVLTAHALEALRQDEHHADILSLPAAGRP